MATVNLGRVVGKSAYELWLEAENTGTMADYLASLKGDAGEVSTAQMTAAIEEAIDPVTSQLADIGKFEATNQIVNGSFESNLNDWKTTPPSGVTVDATQRVTGSSSCRIIVSNQNAGIHQEFNCSIGDKIYYAGWINRISGTGILFDALPKDALAGALNIAMSIEQFAAQTPGQWVRYSGVAVATNGGLRIFVGRTSSQTAELFVDGIIALNLTQQFGAGNEPTAAQMDALLARWPNSWFDGTANIAKCDSFTPYLMDEIRKLRAAVTTLGGTL